MRYSEFVDIVAHHHNATIFISGIFNQFYECHCPCLSIKRCYLFWAAAEYVLHSDSKLWL